MTADELFETVCKPTHKKWDEELSEIKGIAKSTHKALCESNGKPSVLSRLSSLEEASMKPKKTLFGIPVEGRDIPITIMTLGVTALVLERFGALEPILRIIAKQ